LKLKARPATIKDKAQLLAWANEQEIRRQSFTTRKITKEEHNKWFSRVLADYNNQRLFILENHGLSPLGQVRFSRIDVDDWEIHFSMGAQYRGQKLGSQMIRVSVDVFLGQEQRSRITAKVKKDNAASLRSLARAGFQVDEKHGTDDLETRLIYISK
jgi:RimJ/RimL family protein N-acetyltransferase